jgi:hypothetical protein
VVSVERNAQQNSLALQPKRSKTGVVLPRWGGGSGIFNSEKIHKLFVEVRKPTREFFVAREVVVCVSFFFGHWDFLLQKEKGGKGAAALSLPRTDTDAKNPGGLLFEKYWVGKAQLYGRVSCQILHRDSILRKTNNPNTGFYSRSRST